MEQITKNDIEHLGRITSFDSEKITVSIVSQASCVSCSVKGNCSVGEVEEKIVEVANTGDRSLKINDMVTVILDVKSGALAVLLGYFFPFLVLLLTLIAMISLGLNEGISGLIAILMLIPYYAILYITKRQQNKTFSFRLK